MFATVVVLGMSLQIVAEENEAEKLVRAFEAKVVAAEVVKIAGSMTMEGGKSEMKSDLKLLFAKGNKAKIDLNSESLDKKKGFSISLVSDGTTMQLRAGPDSRKTLPVSKYLHEYLCIGNSRLGLVTCLTYMQPEQLKRAEFDPDTEMRLSAFELRRTEKLDGRDATVVSYRTGRAKESGITYTLWLDSKTMLPIKRNAVTAQGARVTETYKEFILDPKIQGSPFEIPGSRPTAEPNEAEKLFRAFEEKLFSAKAIQISAMMCVEGGKSDSNLDLTILMQARKTRMTIDTEVKKKKLDFVLISDGDKMNVSIFGLGIEQDCPKQFQRFLRAGISRQGLVTAMIVLELRKKAAEFPDPDEFPQLSDFELCKSEKVGEKDAKVITFRPNDLKKDKTTLWLDAKTLMPLKRFHIRDGTGLQQTEKYKEFILEPVIDATRFELPKD